MAAGLEIWEESDRDVVIVKNSRHGGPSAPGELVVKFLLVASNGVSWCWLRVASIGVEWWQQMVQFDFESVELERDGTVRGFDSPFSGTDFDVHTVGYLSHASD